MQLHVFDKESLVEAHEKATTWILCCWQKLMRKVHEREGRYHVVMRDLIKRYIMRRQRQDQTDGVTEDDLNEIKQVGKIKGCGSTAQTFKG